MNSSFDEKLQGYVGAKDALSVDKPLRWLPWVGDNYTDNWVYYV